MKKLDPITVLSISVAAWALFAIAHELIGHALVAALLGEEVLGAVSTTVHINDFYDLDRVAGRIGWWGFRAVAAGGTLVNLLLAGLALSLLARRPALGEATRFFLWLFATLSIFQQSFWLAVMPFAALGGDWTAFFVNIDHDILWKSVVTAIGLFLLWAGVRLPLRIWSPALAVEPARRRRQITLLTILPVLAMFATQVLSILWSPFSGPRHTWVVTVFSFLPIAILVAVLSPRSLWPQATDADRSLIIERSLAWIVAGVAAFVVFVALLGPGVGSFEGHPSYAG